MPPVVMAVAAVVGAGAAVVGTIQAGKAQRASAAEQRKQQQLQTQMQRRSSIRQAQLQRAQAQSFGQAAGAAGGSGMAGGLSSFGSQFGAASGYSTQMSGLSQNITNLNAKAQRGQNIAQIGGSLYGAAGGMGAVKDWWNSQ